MHVGGSTLVPSCYRRLELGYGFDVVLPLVAIESDIHVDCAIHDGVAEESLRQQEQQP